MARWQNRAPTWFWVLAVVLALWGAMGIVAFYKDVMTTPAQLAAMSDYDRTLLASRPAWFLWLYGAAVWSGLFAAIALLWRSAVARPLALVSLVLVIVMFGYIFAKTDLIAVKGFAAAAGFPILIAVIASVQLWLAGTAIRRGWSR